MAAASAPLSGQFSEIKTYLASIEERVVPTWGSIASARQSLITSRLRKAVQILYAEGLTGKVRTTFLNELVPLCANNLRQICSDEFTEEPADQTAGYDSEHIVRVIQAIKKALPAIEADRFPGTGKRPLHGLSALTGNSWTMPWIDSKPIMVGLGKAQATLGVVPKLGCDTFLRLENQHFSCSADFTTATISEPLDQTVLSTLLPRELVSLIAGFTNENWILSPNCLGLNLAMTIYRAPVRPLSADAVDAIVPRIWDEITLLDAQLEWIGYNEYGVIAHVTVATSSPSSLILVARPDVNVCRYYAETMVDGSRKVFAHGMEFIRCSYHLGREKSPTINGEKAIALPIDKKII